MADKLMYIFNDHTQNYPFYIFWLNLMNQPIKMILVVKPTQISMNFAKCLAESIFNIIYYSLSYYPLAATPLEASGGWGERGGSGSGNWKAVHTIFVCFLI